jgi:type IV pilus assembly protein PilW
MEVVTHKKHGIHKQQGMNLVEILIAMFLGIFLIAGTIQVYFGSKQTYRMQDNLARLQENGRFALDYISRDIRMADSWGCLKEGLAKVSNSNKTLYAGYAAGVDGIEGATTLISDELTLVGVAGGKSAAVLSQTSTSGNITVASNINLKAKDVALVADCKQGDVFTVGSVAGKAVSQNVGGGQDVSKNYGAKAFIYPLKKSRYFIQKSNGDSALYVSINNASPERLVEGVENMQILYGEDTKDKDNTANYFVPRDQVINMDKVVSIRIHLLVASIDANLTTAPVPYQFNGQASITPTDMRLRRVFSSTVAIRNRLP